MSIVEHLFEVLALGTGLVLVGGVMLARMLRSRGLRWTWAALGFPAAFLLLSISGLLALVSFAVAGLGCALGASWHHQDITDGADLAEIARARLGVFQALRHRYEERGVRARGWVHGGGCVSGAMSAAAEYRFPLGTNQAPIPWSSARPAPGRRSARRGSSAG